ncbi:hypothetical protein [Chitinophaga silvisoli]|uniref:hypothetical protein n=1 Tax=Chitinophaga silvisoli TaxID=2291814 RepID=UPI0011C17D4E|nr:hypothetical protein [Chitinophaga silvisoli]
MKYEFVPYALIADRSDLVHDRNPKFPGYLRGHFPDDIRMSLANIAMVLSKGSLLHFSGRSC